MDIRTPRRPDVDPEVASNRIDIDTYFERILSEYPFYASVVRQLKTIYNSDLEAAAGVAYKDGYRLYVNPVRLIGTDPEEIDEQERYERNRRIRGILIHECLHIVYGHVAADPLDDKDNQTFANIAYDLRINQDIPRRDMLPGWVVAVGEGIYKDWPFGEPSEVYYRMLCELQPDGDGQRGAPGGDLIDDHSEFGIPDADMAIDETEDSPAQIAERRREKIVREAADAASGDVPSEISEAIGIGEGGDVDWRDALRDVIARTSSTDTVRTRKRLNRRWGIKFAGQKSQTDPRIAVAVDQSGSISDRQLERFFGELRELSRFRSFVVVPFDSTVGEPFEWEANQIPDVERQKRGGTNFDPPTEWAQEHRIDGLVILTDMRSSKPKSCSMRRIWVRPSSCNPSFETSEPVIEIR